MEVPPTVRTEAIIPSPIHVVVIGTLPPFVKLGVDFECNTLVTTVDSSGLVCNAICGTHPFDEYGLNAKVMWSVLRWLVQSFHRGRFDAQCVDEVQVSGKKQSIAILGCAGIISGFLTIHPPLPRDYLRDMEIWAGAVFGITLAIFLWVFQRPRSIRRVIAVIVSSAFAYEAAYFSTIMAYMWMPHLFNSAPKSTNPPSYVMFVGGTLGALIISTTVLVLYRDESTELGSGILICTLGGGVLGVFGYSLGLLFTGQHHSSVVMPGITCLHIVWQAGMGCLLAAYLPEALWPAETEPRCEASRKDNPPG